MFALYKAVLGCVPFFGYSKKDLQTAIGYCDQTNNLLAGPP